MEKRHRSFGDGRFRPIILCRRCERVHLVGPLTPAQPGSPVDGISQRVNRPAERLMTFRSFRAGNRPGRQPGRGTGVNFSIRPQKSLTVKDKGIGLHA